MMKKSKNKYIKLEGECLITVTINMVFGGFLKQWKNVGFLSHVEKKLVLW